MPIDQPPAAESSVEDRLTAFFGGPAALQQPQATEESAPEETQADESQQVEEPVTEEGADEAPAEEAAPELAEVEYNGKTFKVDPELREAVMLKSDYTQKTQEIASVRRTLEIEKAAFQSAQAFNQQVSGIKDEMNRLTSLKEQAERIDRNSLNTDQRLDLDYELRKIDRQIADLDGQIKRQESDHQARFNQFVVAAVMESEKFMSRKVPGWNEQSGKALHEYGVQLGIPTEKLTTGWFADPTATHVMWKAQQWDKLQSSKPAVANKASGAPPVSKPGSSAAQKSLQQSEYRKARDQLKKSGSLEDAAKLFMRI